MNKFTRLLSLVWLFGLSSMLADSVPTNCKELDLVVQEEISWWDYVDKWIDEILYSIFDQSMLSPMRQEVLKRIGKEEFNQLVLENLEEQKSYLTSTRVLACTLGMTTAAFGVIFYKIAKKVYYEG